MLLYDAGESSILIDWERLKIFAMLDAPLGKRESITGRFAPVSSLKWGMKRPKKRIREIIAETKPTHLQRLIERPEPRVLTLDEMSLFHVLEDMTEDEYTALVKSFPEYDRAKQLPMISA